MLWPTWYWYVRYADSLQFVQLWAPSLSTKAGDQTKRSTLNRGISAGRCCNGSKTIENRLTQQHAEKKQKHVPYYGFIMFHAVSESLIWTFAYICCNHDFTAPPAPPNPGFTNRRPDSLNHCFPSVLVDPLPSGSWQEGKKTGNKTLVT